MILGSLSLLAERFIGRIARADLGSQESVLSAAVDAYIYGYPLAIKMDMTRRQLHQLCDCPGDSRTDGPIAPTAELSGSR